MIRIDNSLLPALLVAVAAAGFLMAGVLPPRGRWRRLSVGAAALLLLAAVGVRAPARTGAGSVLLVDVSYSTGSPPVDIAAMGRRAGLSPENTTVLLFGKTIAPLAGREGSWPTVGEFDVRRAGRGASALGGALRSAVERVEEGGRVVVLTDGRAPFRGVRDAAANVRLAGGRIEVLGHGRRAAGDHRVESLRLPSRVSEKSRIEATITVAGDPGRRVEIVLLVDGRESKRRGIDLPVGGRGSVRFAVPPLPAGYHEVTARLVPVPGDLAPENDRLAAGVVVAGRRRALLVGAAGLEEMLEDRGYVAVSGDVERLRSPSDFDLVVLRDIPATSIPRGGAALEEYVAGGGGLLVLGGGRSFGPGGYAGRPLEAALPLLSAPPDESLLVVVLIDRSSSMGEPFTGGGAGRKIDAAREATRRLLRALPPGTTFLVVPFSGTVDGSPAPIRLTDAKGRAAAERIVDGLDHAEGTTALSPPLEAALVAVSGRPDARALTLLLSDGRIEGEDPEAVVRRARELTRAGGRLRVLAVGEDADFELLRRLGGKGPEPASVGDGEELETAFLLEFLAVSGEGKVIRERREVRVGTGADSPWPEALPAIEGLVRTWPRPGAEVWHGCGEDLPVVAGWRHGLGTAVAVATDPLGPWADGWSKTGLLAALADRAARKAEHSGPRVELASAEGRIEVRARLDERAAEVEGRLSRPGVPPTVIRLHAVGPGVYRGETAAPDPGAWRLTVEAGAGLFDGGVAVPYPDEFRETGPDAAGLRALREAVGVDEPRGEGERDLRAVPALLALLLFVLDRLSLLKRGGLLKLSLLKRSGPPGR